MTRLLRLVAALCIGLLATVAIAGPRNSELITATGLGPPAT